MIEAVYLLGAGLLVALCLYSVHCLRILRVQMSGLVSQTNRDAPRVGELVLQHLQQLQATLANHINTVSTAHARDLHQALGGLAQLVQTTKNNVDAVAADQAAVAQIVRLNVPPVPPMPPLVPPRITHHQPPIPVAPNAASLPFPPHDAELCAYWDREWLVYLSTESMYAHLAPPKEIRQLEDISGRTARETFYSKVGINEDYHLIYPLRVWCPGDEMIGKDVLEIGCGCGVTAKQVGPICRSYLGLDYSLLALAIADGGTLDNCTFTHIANSKALAPQAATRDVLISREFFIHQNFHSAAMVLRVAGYLLRDGGLACCDFFFATSPTQPGRRDAKSPADPDNPSSGFHYSDAEIDELAELCGYDIMSQEIVETEYRRFVIMQKRPSAAALQ